MKKSLLCGMVMTIACLTTSAAFGHDDKDMDHKMMDHKMMMMGKHSMEGSIEKIDHKTGWVSVKTGEGTLAVHFPPASIKDLKEGEMISVHLGFSKGGKEKSGEMMEEKGKMDDKMKMKDDKMMK